MGTLFSTTFLFALFLCARSPQAIAAAPSMTKSNSATGHVVFIWARLAEIMQRQSIKPQFKIKINKIYLGQEKNKKGIAFFQLKPPRACRRFQSANNLFFQFEGKIGKEKKQNRVFK